VNPEILAMKKRIEAKKREDDDKKQKLKKVFVSRTVKRTAPTLKCVPVNTYCVYCGKLLDTTSATIDHVIPLSRGGTNTIGNRVYACVECNSSKADMLLPEWYAKIFGVKLDRFDCMKEMWRFCKK